MEPSKKPNAKLNITRNNISENNPHRMKTIIPKLPAMQNNRLYQVINKLIRLISGPIIAIAFGLLIGAFFILLTGTNPIDAYIALIKGAIIGIPSLFRTLRWMIPILIAGIAACVSFRAGMFNAGIEGAIWLGGIAATLMGVYFKLPSFLHIPLCLVVAGIVGGIWCLIPGIAKVKYQVNEVVFGLMLNSIAIYIVQYVVLYIFLDKARLAYSFTEAETQYIQHSAELPWLNKTYQLSSGLLIAIGLAILLHFLLKNSKWGYENKISGLNIIFARFSGMPILKIAASAMFVSGLLSGLTGAVLVMGDYHRFLAQFSINLGMDGITAALMGNLNPLGTLLSSFFMAILKNGGAAMELKVNVPYDLVTVVQASVLLFITSTRLLEYLKIKKVEHKED